MRFSRAHFAYSVLVLAGGLCLAACSKDEKTALEVNVTLGGDVKQQPDAVRFVLKGGGTTFIDRQADWSAASAGMLKVTLLLPAQAAGSDTLEVSALLGLSKIAEAPPQTITITAGKAYGPLAVVLQPAVVSVDGGTDALSSDGPHPDLAAGSEVGVPDASVTPDTRIDEPGPEAAAPDALLAFDSVQPDEVAPSPDAPQVSDVAATGGDVAQPTDAGADLALLTDAVEAGEDAGADSFVGPAWQPVRNVQYDPNDPIISSGSPDLIAVAVDPVNEHVYVMWTDGSTSAVRVTRWNHATGKWEPTQTLEDNGPGDPKVPQIGVDGAGHVIAAWCHDFSSSTSDSTINQMGGVWVSRSTDGTSWSAAASVTPQRPRQVQELSLAVARNGQARIAFSETPTVSPYAPLLYSAYFDGTTWTTGQDPLAQEAPDDTNFRNPSVAIGVDDSGNSRGIILFKQKDPNDPNHYDSVAASTFAGANVDGYVILDSNTTDNLSETTMAVAVNRSGQGVVVWGDSDGAMLSSYSPSIKKWTARNIGNVGPNSPSMVMAPDGTITLAWQQEASSGYFNVWAMEGTVDGNWTTTPLETDNLAIQTGGYWGYYETLPFPALAVDGDGNVLALWRKKTQNTPFVQFAVYARRKLAGKPNGVWQPATELARKSYFQPLRASLAVSDHGLGAVGYYWTDPNDDPNTPVDPDAYQVFVSLFR